MATGQPAVVGLPLRLDQLGKRFGEVVAVDRIDLEIAAGEFLTLLGPSGSGKTTTLMMIAGFTEPSEGRIWLGSQPVDMLPSYRRGFGMVFQNYALFPHMTAAENIGFPLKMRGISGKERTRRAEEALELVRLPGFGGRYPNQLSGGQQQRVALARALVYNPPVLLMDEPLGALDKKLREEMQLEIKRIQAQLGITAVYVTHDQEEALVMSDRIAVMNLGKIEQVDAPSRIYEHPATRFVADFIGESNIIQLTAPAADGVLQSAVGPLRVQHGEGRGVAATPTGLIVRPEKIRFASDEPNLDNVLMGSVVEVVYAGDATKYRVLVPGDLALIVKRQNRAGQPQFQIGDTVELGWRAEDGSLV
jgi:putative spermidine/putrescine transport system ATP-binding protein